MNADIRDPSTLVPNPWNTNHLTPEAELRLENSLARVGCFKPVIVRERDDGTLQILGGEHRARAAQRLGWKEIPVFNLGRIDDARAKEIGILDNGRYGHDDAVALANLLEELGDPLELASFMPFDPSELEAMSKVTKIDLDTLELADEDAPAPEPQPQRAPKSHVVMRFKVPIADQEFVEAQIRQTIQDQGLDDSDSLVNAGDALIWLLRAWALAAGGEDA